MYTLSKSSRSDTFIKTVKFLGNCQARLNDNENTQDWLAVKEQLIANDNDPTGVRKAGLLKGLFEKNKQVIIKYSTTELIKSDYEIAHLLHKAKLPNLIKYICDFECNEDLPNIVKRNFQTKPYLCKKDGTDRIKAIVMSYYPLGSINDYAWTQSNFADYINLIKQACFAVLYAYETVGFIHGDFHLDNILIKTTKRRTLNYGTSIQLPIGSKYAVIMDFERSLIVAPEHREEYRSEAYKSIKQLIVLALNEKDNATISFRADDTTIEGRMFLYNIGQFESKNPPITPEIYTRIGKYIDMIIPYNKNNYGSRAKR
jgi:serine/threonine protein kinase